MAGATSVRLDDARHSVLSRARRTAQADITAYGEDRPIVPRSDFGPFEVKEVDARSALTDFALDPGTYSLNPYVGCSHACAYCYVPDVARVQRERWGSYVIAKRNLPRILSRELHRRPRKSVFMSSATDPYQPAEHHHRITRRCLEVLARADWPVRVLTRGPLVTRDLDLLTRFSSVRVGLSVPTIDDAIRRAIEPHAPPVAARLAALRRLTEAGLDTYANLAPAYPLTSGTSAEDVAHAFAETGVPVVYAGAWGYLDGVLPVVRDRVDGTSYAQLARWVDDPAHARRMFVRLADAFHDTGVRFEEMGLGRIDRRPVPRSRSAPNGRNSDPPPGRAEPVTG